MEYLCGTVSIPLMLEANSSNNLYWWIDGAFANHDDMWSHTGGALSLGWGVPTHQKLDMHSLTEAELVVVDDRYFFITNWTNQNDLKVIHCPTENMLGDYFTKPLQRALFHWFHDGLMNSTDPVTGSPDHRSVLCLQTQSHMTKATTNHDSVQTPGQAQACHVANMTTVGSQLVGSFVTQGNQVLANIPHFLSKVNLSSSSCTTSLHNHLCS